MTERKLNCDSVVDGFSFFRLLLLHYETIIYSGLKVKIPFFSSFIVCTIWFKLICELFIS